MEAGDPLPVSKRIRKCFEKAAMAVHHHTGEMIIHTKFYATLVAKATKHRTKYRML